MLFKSVLWLKMSLQPEFWKSCSPGLPGKIPLSFQISAQRHFLQKVFLDFSYPKTSFFPCAPTYVPFPLCYSSVTAILLTANAVTQRGVLWKHPVREQWYWGRKTGGACWQVEPQTPDAGYVPLA